MSKVYRVVAYKVDDHSVDDDTLIDNYGEAAELACNWQQYYDDCFEEGLRPEIIVCIEELDALCSDLTNLRERSLIDG